MARNRILRNSYLWFSLAWLALPGCPSSCQQRNTRQLVGDRVEVKVQKAEIEQEKQTTAKRGHKVTKRLRPDGTPWEITEEKDSEDTVIEFDRELMEKAEGATLKWHNNTTSTKPWWHWPVIVVVKTASPVVTPRAP
mgnify:CR=1 FL=1